MSNEWPTGEEMIGKKMGHIKLTRNGPWHIERPDTATVETVCGSTPKWNRWYSNGNFCYSDPRLCPKCKAIVARW